MIRIYPSKIEGHIKAPASKAHAQRLLFASAMTNTPTLIKNVPECDDIDTTLQCLLDFGCTIEKHGETDVKVFPFVKTNPAPTAEFDFRQSGTTAHLALPLAAAFGVRAQCKASGTLIRRKLISLSSRMALRGVRFSNFNLPLTMSGVLQPGEYVFPGDEGSQFISGTLMALPLLRGDSIVKVSSPLIDGSFIDVTLNVLETFGVELSVDEEGFHVPGKQFYKSPGKLSVENDWALGAMWACAGSLAKEESIPAVTVEELPARSVQTHKGFKNIMALLRQDVRYVNIDAGETPNLACLYACIAAAKGAGIDIKGVPQLRYKETDRMKTLAACLRTIGIDATSAPDGIHIKRKENPDYPESAVIDCGDDPWVFMSLVLSSGCLRRPITLSDEHCAEKIYRNFLRDFEMMGGKFEIL